MGSTHEIQMDDAIENHLEKIDGEIYLIKNTLDKPVDLTIKIKNFNGDEVNPEFILNKGDLNFIKINQMDDGDELSVSFCTVVKENNSINIAEQLVYQCADSQDFNIASNHKVSIRKTIMNIFDPIMEDKKLLLQLTSSDGDFNDIFLDNYYKDNDIFDRMENYSESIRFIYLEFELHSEG